MKKRGLGGNVNLFLSRAKSIENTPPSAEKQAQALSNLPVDHLQRGRYQPRNEISSTSLQDLVDSIRAQGIIQPIVVRKIADDRYEIIAGERRWRAAQLAGLTEIPAIIKNVPDEAALAIALIENIQRENLNPIEEAVALQRLVDEFGLTHQQIADSVGKSRAMVTNLLRLLSLHPEVKLFVEQGKLEMGHARALLTLSGEEQRLLAQTIVAEGLSVRATESLVAQQPKTLKKVDGLVAKTVDPNIQHLQQKLRDQLGAKVVFQQSNSNKGKMVIHYNSLDELEGILSRIH